MRQQNFEEKNERIHARFSELKKESPEKLKDRLKLSWSNWGFGREALAASAERLERNAVPYIELHGNHYGPDLGYDVDETLKILGDHGLRVSGVCGMFSVDNDMACNRALVRQEAINYLKREVPFTREVGGEYLLVVPGAVGRPQAYDDVEFERSAETLKAWGHLFTENGVKAAIEPIRSVEVSLVHTVADAKRYLRAVNHAGVGHINGDVYHMQAEESHIGEAIVDAGDQLVNLHFADSNRAALGEGFLDVATVIRALYQIGYNEGRRFVTFEPLGPGGDPYRAMHGKPDKAKLDALVSTSIRYFREVEEMVLAG